jgi:hypothetical protein
VTGPNTEAVAWAEAGFDASLIGLRAAAEHVLLTLRGVARTGGDIDRCRASLAMALRELDHRAGALPPSADGVPTYVGEPRPRGLGLPPCLAATGDGHGA